MATEQNVMAVIRASRPSFRSPQDKVAYAIHASFLAAGYVLVATGPPAFADDALSSLSTYEVGVDGWNQFEDNYAFLYLNPQKGSKKVLVKCLCLNDKLMVEALSDGDSEPLHLEISVGDYFAENGGSNYSSQFKNLGDLVARVDKEILSKLSDPSTAKPLRGVVPPAYPTVGGTDGFPWAGGGTYPGSGDLGSGGGMLVGPDHPLFAGRLGGQQPGFPGAPPPVHPPGARFDPFGPPDVPGFEPDRFERPGGGTHPDLEHFGDNDFI